MKNEYHLLVKRLLDGELGLADLPPELRADGEEALRWIAAADRRPVALSGALEHRVMAAVRGRAASPARRAWRWVTQPRDVRVRVRPWMLGPALAAAAALVVLLGRSGGPSVGGLAAVPESLYVRFVLYAPEAKQVALAGTFNDWSPGATLLVRAGAPGVWTATLALPVGQHQYVFVVDGERWVADPAAPGVDDGFGRRNSLVAVTPAGGNVL